MPVEVRDASECVRGQQGLKEGASWEHPAGAEMRRLLRAVGNKYIAKSNKHRVRTVWSVLQLRGPGNCWSERKTEGKIHPAKIGGGEVFKSFYFNLSLLCVSYVLYILQKICIRSCQWNPVRE